MEKQKLIEEIEGLKQKIESLENDSISIDFQLNQFRTDDYYREEKKQEDPSWFARASYKKTHLKKEIKEFREKIHELNSKVSLIKKQENKDRIAKVRVSKITNDELFIKCLKLTLQNRLGVLKGESIWQEAIELKNNEVNKL